MNTNNANNSVREVSTTSASGKRKRKNVKKGEAKKIRKNSESRENINADDGADISGASESSNSSIPKDKSHVSENDTQESDVFFAEQSVKEVQFREHVHNSANDHNGSWHDVTGKEKKKYRANKNSSFRLPEPKVFTYPVLIEDFGTGTDLYKNYGAATNSIWKLNRCGAIVSQRQCKTKSKWMIECATFGQQQQIAQMTTIKTHEGVINIKAQIPVATTEGVIGPINKNWSDEMIEQLIAESGEPVNIKKVFRLYKKHEKEEKSSPCAAVKIIFLSNDLPSAVKVGTQYFTVEPFRKPVKRCLKCQKLDHVASDCSRKEARCPRGCLQAHALGVRECPRQTPDQWQCVNCNAKGHSAAYAGCPARKQLQTAHVLRAKHYMPLGVALKHAKSQHDAVTATTNNRRLPIAQRRRSSTPDNARRATMSYFKTARKFDQEVGDCDFPPLPPSKDSLKSVWDTSFQFTSSAGGARRPMSWAERADRADRKSKGSTTIGAAPAGSGLAPTGPQSSVVAGGDSGAATLSSAKQSTTPMSAPQPSAHSSQGPSTGYSSLGPSSSQSGPLRLSLELQGVVDFMTSKFRDLEAKLEVNNDNIHKEVKDLDKKMQEMKDERKRQLQSAGDIVRKNKSKNHDVVTKMAFDIVDSLIETAQGNSQALMRVLYNLAPNDSVSSLPTPPRMSEELQTALLNVMGYSVVTNNN